MIVSRNNGVYVNYNDTDGSPLSTFYGFNLDGFAAGSRRDSKVTFLDRLYTFNLSEEKAYERMKNDMPVESLIALQNQFRKIFEKISLQPEGEREYDVDISLGSPFL